MNYHSAFVRLPVVRENGDVRISTPEEAARACADISSLAQEAFHVLTLNAKNRIINRHLITLGIADASLVHAREVFRPAVVDGAASVVLAHNHPSGDPQPSREDIQVTRQLIEAGKILNIPVLDHVIVGRAEASGTPAHVSLRDKGFCKFQ